MSEINPYVPKWGNSSQIIAMLTDLTREMAELRAMVSTFKKCTDEERLAIDVKRLEDLALSKNYNDEFKKIIESHPETKFYITFAGLVHTEKEMARLLQDPTKLYAVSIPNSVYEISRIDGNAQNRSCLVRRSDAKLVGCMCNIRSHCKESTGLCWNIDDIADLLISMSHVKNLFYVHPELLIQADYFASV